MNISTNNFEFEINSICSFICAVTTTCIIKMEKRTFETVIKLIKSLNKGDKFLILSKIEVSEKTELKDFFQFYFDQGYARIEYEGETINIQDSIDKDIKNSFYLIVDRSIYNNDNDYENTTANYYN